MNKSIAWSAAILLLSLLTLSAGCGRNEAAIQDTDQPIAVTVVAAEVKPHHESFSVSGLVAPTEEAMLSFKSGGVIRDIPAEPGQRFRKGDLLALLDTTEIAAMVADARETSLLANSELKRVQKLQEAAVATDQQLEAAQRGNERARAGLVSARFNLEHSEIRAPYDGIVNLKLANKGEIAGPGQPILRVLEDNAGSAMCVRVSVTGTWVGELKVGQSCEVGIETLPQPVTGRITEISTSAEPGAGGFPVKVEWSSRKDVYPGLLATVKFQGGDRPLTELPAISLSGMDDDRGYVFLVMDNRASRWPVTIAGIEKDAILVEPDLPAGSLVIEKGAGYLTDGHPVSVVEAMP